MNRRTAVLAIGALLCPAWAEDAPPNPLASAQPGDVRLFVSNAILKSLTVVRPQLEQMLGHRLVLRVGESREMQVEILAGQAFEVAVMIGPVIDAMIAQGMIVAGSRVDLGLERIAVGARGRFPALDIQSDAGIRAMLAGAARISRFYGAGASVETADKLFSMLDIGKTLDAKIIRRGGRQPEPSPLPTEQYEIYIDTDRVIAQTAGWTDLGLLAEKYQVPVVLAAGVGVAGDKAIAKRLIDFLKAPGFDKALTDYGITRQ
jgi:molybdate transport system substrate-binding protein